MIIAQKKDKPLVVDLLVQCFYNNKSIHYIIEKERQDKHHIQALMRYAFDYCMNFGIVFLSDNREACALILYPEKKTLLIEPLWQQLRLTIGSSDARYFKKMSDRQKIIRQIHPAGRKFHVWFMGVRPGMQKQGIGTAFLKELIAVSMQQQRIFCLETPDSRHLPWLHANGFGIYRQLDLGYLLYCLLHKDILWKMYPFHNSWNLRPGEEKRAMGNEG